MSGPWHGNARLTWSSWSNDIHCIQRFPAAVNLFGVMSQPQRASSMSQSMSPNILTWHHWSCKATARIPAMRRLYSISIVLYIMIFVYAFLSKLDASIMCIQLEKQVHHHVWESCDDHSRCGYDEFVDTDPGTRIACITVLVRHWQQGFWQDFGMQHGTPWCDFQFVRLC